MGVLEDGGGSLTGSGNRFIRLLIKRGICSLLLGCETSPFTGLLSTEPWSDLEDSDMRMSCSEGLFVVPLWYVDVDSRPGSSWLRREWPPNVCENGNLVWPDPLPLPVFIVSLEAFLEIGSLNLLLRADFSKLELVGAVVIIVGA